MPPTTGTRLGSYEILSQLGAGGMGEVYRARDAKLNRDVALKVLPELFALDPERLARFRREAQLLASLNHPNIAAIYGLEESAGVQALVLELVDGPTLADVIAGVARVGVASDFSRTTKPSSGSAPMGPAPQSGSRSRTREPPTCRNRGRRTASDSCSRQRRAPISPSGRFHSTTGRRRLLAVHSRRLQSLPRFHPMADGSRITPTKGDATPSPSSRSQQPAPNIKFRKTILGAVLGSEQTQTGTPTAPEFRIVLNWFEELKARVPVGK